MIMHPVLRNVFQIKIGHWIARKSKIISSTSLVGMSRNDEIVRR